MESQTIKQSILVISPQLPSNPNGGANLLKYRLEELSKDYDLFLVAKDYCLDNTSKENYFKEIKVIKKTKPKNILMFLYRYFLITNFYIYWFILKNKIKIVQIEFYDCLFYSLFLSPLKLFGIKIFYTAHDIQSLYYKKNTFKYRLIKSVEKTLIKYFLDIIFVWGEDDKNELLSWGIKQDKVKIVHPIIIDNQNHWKLNETMNFVFMGSYGHAPNRDSLEIILRMWPDIKKLFPESRLYLVIGKNVNLDINDESIINCGFVVSPEDILSKCNIFLAPIVSGTGIKVKIIESFKFGIPILSTILGFRNFDYLDNSHVLLADKENFFDVIVKISKNLVNLITVSEYQKKYYLENFSGQNIHLYKKYYSQC